MGEAMCLVQVTPEVSVHHHLLLLSRLLQLSENPCVVEESGFGRSAAQGQIVSLQFEPTVAARQPVSQQSQQ